MCSFDSGCQTIWCLCFIIIWLWKCSPLFRFINKPAALLVLSLFFPPPFHIFSLSATISGCTQSACFYMAHTHPMFCHMTALLSTNFEISQRAGDEYRFLLLLAEAMHSRTPASGCRHTTHTNTGAPPDFTILQLCGPLCVPPPPTLWRLHLLTGSWWISSPDSESEFQPACSCRRPALLDEGAAGENCIRCLSSAMLGWWMGVTSTLCMYMKTGFISQVAACCPPYLPNSALATCASFLPDNFSFYVVDTPFPPRLLSAALLHLL